MAALRNRFARTQLGIECLQTRVMPAVMALQLDLDGDGGADDIQIVGDSAKNFVSIQDNGTGTLIISIDANGDGDFTDAKELNNVVANYTGNSVAIDVALSSGNDSFTYTLGGNVSGGMRSLAVDLGAGNDVFTLAATGKNFSAGSRLDVDLIGGTGNDTASVTVGQVLTSQAGIRFDLGTGNDVGSVKFANIDNASSVDIDASLGDGANSMTLDLDGVGKFNQANATVSIVGGKNVDTVAVNLHDDVGDGTLASALLINVALGDGNDVFTAGLDYEGTSFRVDNNSTASITARGGVGNDILSVKGVGTLNSIRIDQGGLLDISLKGDSGDDTIALDLGKPDALVIEGSVRSVIDGGAGNDKLTALFANNSTTTGKYDVTVLGGAGIDQVTFALTNNGGTPTYGPIGKVVLNGGTGKDTLTNGNTGVSLASFFETIV